MVTLLLTLLACGEPDPGSDGTQSTDTTVSDDTDTAQTDPPVDTGEAITFEDREAALDAAGVEVAMEEAIMLLRWIDPTHPLDAFEDALSHGDSACPTKESYASYDRYQDYCTASSGAEFYLLADHYRVGDQTNEGTYYYDYGTLQTEALIIDPEGYSSEASLAMVYLDAEDSSGIRQHTASLFGSYWWDDPIADGSWLTDPTSVSLQSEWYTLPDGHTGAAVLLLGGASGLPGDHVESVSFLELLLASEALGSTCEIEPAGTFSIRAHDGDWYDILFDGPQFGEPPANADSCDGCGEILWRGESLGQACPDLSGLTNWENRPW